MSNVRSLIKRAREFAALEEKATPGPWEWKRWGIFSLAALRYVLTSETNPEAEQRPVAGNDADYDLLEAAPEMATLLRQLADALEEQISSKGPT